MKEDEVFNSDFQNAERIGYLIAGSIMDTLTPIERKELNEWILASGKNEQLFDELTNVDNIQKEMELLDSIDVEKALERIKKRISFERS